MTKFTKEHQSLIDKIIQAQHADIVFKLPEAEPKEGQPSIATFTLNDSPTAKPHTSDILPKVGKTICESLAASGIQATIKSSSYYITLEIDLNQPSLAEHVAAYQAAHKDMILTNAREALSRKLEQLRDFGEDLGNLIPRLPNGESLDPSFDNIAKNRAAKALAAVAKELGVEDKLAAALNTERGR